MGRGLFQVMVPEFRDRAVAAPLKERGLRVHVAAVLQFRDRAVAAPLKVLLVSRSQSSLTQFRDRAVAAPLKGSSFAPSIGGYHNSATARSRPH